MGLFNPEFDPQVGRGIPKAPREKKGFFKFGEIYGRRFWKLLQLNLIYFISIIPIITFGPATAAMTKVCRNWSQERNAFVWSDYWSAFKSNFKQSFIMGIIDIIFLAGFTVAIPSYSEWAEQMQIMYVPLIICLSCCIVFFMMHFYIYLMIVSTNLKLTKIIKNAFFLVSLGVKRAVWTLLVWIVVCFSIYMSLYIPAVFLLLAALWAFSFLCFVNAFNCYPTIRKYVIQPYYDAQGKDNPEFDYLKKEDSIFEDRSDEEPPPEKRTHKKKKTKTIS